MRLSDDQKEKATILYKALSQGKALLKSGSSITQVKHTIEVLFQHEPEIKLEYFEVVDSENLTLLNNVEESETPIVCMAAFVGGVRLIDNMFL
jgi:pantoate--beta-alanine ligase